MNERERKDAFIFMQKQHEEQQRNRLSVIVQAAHMAVTISLNLLSEADEILDETKITLNSSITEKQKKFLKRADKYCKEFSDLIRTDEEKKHYWENIEELDKKFRKWAGLNNPEIIEWHKVSEKLPPPGLAVNVITRNGKYATSMIYINENGKKEWKGSARFTSSIVAWIPINQYTDE